MDHHLLLNILAYLGAAVIAVPLFRRLGLGAILGYLFAGAVIGPQGIHLIEHPEQALHFAEFGVVMLLFIIGLELEPGKLWRMRTTITMLGGGQLLLSAVIIALAVWALFGFQWRQAVLIGLTLGLSSTAFAVQLMDEQGILGSELGRRGFSILLLQDLAVIPLLLLVGVWAPTRLDGAGMPWWSGPLAVLGCLLVGRFGLSPLLKLVALYGSREVLTAAALLIVLGTAMLMESVQLSMGMGAFIAGIILANSNYRHQLEADIEPFKGLLLGLFFIAVGMSLDLQLFVQAPMLIVALALALMAAKAAVVAALVRLSGHAWRDAVKLGLVLSQGGEFAFVVMAKSLNLGLFSTEIADYCVLIVGVSMALTAPCLMLFNRAARDSGPAAQREYDHGVEHESEVIIAGFGRFGQIVGRLLAANGLHFTALDKDASHVDFVRQFGNQIFFGDATRLDLLEAAGLSRARLVVVAVDDIADSMAVVAEIQAARPDLRIIARAHNRAHAYQLHNAGVETVIRETFESGLDAARHTLMALGFSEGNALSKVNLFRKHDENLIRRAVAHKDNRDELIAITVQGREELEALFRQDNAH